MHGRHVFTAMGIAILLFLSSCADYVDGPFHPRGGDDNHDSTSQTDTTDHGDTTGGGGADTTGGGTGPHDTTVCFTRDVLPILISNCTMAECHDVDRPKEGVNLTSYESIMGNRDGLVRPGNPSRSKLYESLVTDESDERMPPPPRSLSKAQIAVIERWIREGAKNRDCSADNGGCDTRNVTYVGTIAPIMATSCTGCHSGTRPSGGIDLTVRSVVEAQARDGFLLGTMSHASGYAPMPPSGPRMSDCSIEQVRAWIATGMK